MPWFKRYGMYTVTLKLGFRVTQGHRKWHYSTEYVHVRLLFVFYSKYASIYYRFRDIATYWSKIVTPLYSAPPPLRGEAVRLCNNLSRRKTRMMGLSGNERISMILSAVLIQSTRVTDGQTELPWHIRAICCGALKASTNQELM